MAGWSFATNRVVDVQAQYPLNGTHHDALVVAWRRMESETGIVEARTRRLLTRGQFVPIKLRRKLSYATVSDSLAGEGGFLTPITLLARKSQGRALAARGGRLSNESESRSATVRGHSMGGRRPGLVVLGRPHRRDWMAAGHGFGG